MRRFELLRILKDRGVRPQQGEYLTLWYYPPPWPFYKVFKTFTPKEVLNLTHDELEELFLEYELIKLFTPPNHF